MKPPSCCTIANWILKVWEEIILETIRMSFKSWSSHLATDGSEDNLIHCFKEDGPCKANKRRSVKWSLKSLGPKSYKKMGRILYLIAITVQNPEIIRK